MTSIIQRHLTRCNAPVKQSTLNAINAPYAASRRYELDQKCKRAVRLIDETTVEVDAHHGAKQFVFDNVFSEGHSQESVFQETRNLVQSALDGYEISSRRAKLFFSAALSIKICVSNQTSALLNKSRLSFLLPLDMNDVLCVCSSRSPV